MSAEWRQRRIAENEQSFRAINDRLAEGLERVRHLPERVDFICECGSRTCVDRVSLSLDEYRTVRGDSRTFAVRPGHVYAEAEVVTGGNSRYQVVRKTGLAGRVVEAG